MRLKFEAIIILNATFAEVQNMLEKLFLNLKKYIFFLMGEGSMLKVVLKKKKIKGQSRNSSIYILSSPLF